MSVGSEPATSGSVMAKHDRAVPSQSGPAGTSPSARRCPSAGACAGCPRPGAWALRTNGPIDTFAASADTAAIAVGPRPMPPHSGGMCGSQSCQSSLACWRSDTIVDTTALRSSWSVASQAGATTSSMNARTLRRTSSTSGGNVKSIIVLLELCLDSGFPGGECSQNRRSRSECPQRGVLRASDDTHRPCRPPRRPAAPRRTIESARSDEPTIRDEAAMIPPLQQGALVREHHRDLQVRADHARLAKEAKAGARPPTPLAHPRLELVALGRPLLPLPPRRARDAGRPSPPARRVGPVRWPSDALGPRPLRGHPRPDRPLPR